MGLQRGARGAEADVIGIVHLDGVAAGEQLAEHRALRRLQVSLAGGLDERGLGAAEKRLLAFDHLELAVDPALDDRRGEAAVVEAHALHVAHARGRHVLGRREQRHHRARARPASRALPREEIVGEQRQDAGDGCAPRCLVFEREPRGRGLGRFGDHALGPAHGDRHPFVWRERGGRADQDLARLLRNHFGVAVRRALRPGVERTLGAERHGLR
jgi:hypothetical protein